MKKIFALGILAGILSGCSSPKDRSEEAMEMISGLDCERVILSIGTSMVSRLFDTIDVGCIRKPKEVVDE